VRSYRVDSKTVRIEVSDDAESIVLEVVRTGLARSRADRNDPPLINSSYARAMRTGPGRSSSSSQAASVAVDRALEYWRLLVRVARSIRPYGIDHPFDLKAEWRLAKRSIFPMNPSQKVYIPDEPLLS
jgi:hypothetical protein